MRYLLLSVFVVSLVGILVIPHTFAETDNDIVSYVDSEGKFSIEFPDGWSIVETRDKNYTHEKVTEVGAIIKDADGETVIRITVWAWIKLDEPLDWVWAPNDLPYPEDYTDKDMRNVISGRNAWYCSFEVCMMIKYSLGMDVINLMWLMRKLFSRTKVENYTW